MKKKLILDYLISSLSSDMESCRLSVPCFAVERRAEEIWKQKIFCVISSQFNAQRAALIVDRMIEKISFFDRELPYPKIEEECFSLLSSPEIGYRFPKVRALHISLCWFLFWQIKDDYHGYVSSFGTEERAREEIAEIFPGFGLKQASMLLRNIGACRNLSVIDIHMLFYLKIRHNWFAEHLTPRRYLEAEDLLRKDASRYGLELNVFDTIVWGATKALKRTYGYV